MSLKLRPTGLASPVDKDRGDYTLFSGEWAMERIYEERGSPQHLRWYWSLHGILGKPLDMRTDGRGIRAITDHLRVDLHRHYAASYAAAVIFSRASELLSTSGSSIAKSGERILGAMGVVCGPKGPSSLGTERPRWPRGGPVGSSEVARGCYAPLLDMIP
jgi:hypothetical protein